MWKAASASASASKSVPVEKKALDTATSDRKLLEAAGRDRPVGQLKGAARPRIRIGMVTPTMTKGRGKGGWTPQLDRLGRIDVSYRGCPFQYLPPGARAGENLRRGDITIRQEDVIREVLPPADEEALEMASRMRLVREGVHQLPLRHTGPG